jgi:exosortase B
MTAQAVAPSPNRAFWWVVLAGWLSLAVPSLWDYLFGQWAEYSQGHELLLLAVIAWLLWRQWPQVAALPDVPVRVLPVVGLALGLLLYAFGRMQEFVRAEILALWWTSVFVMLICRGLAGLRRTWFVWLFALFIVPIPFSLVLALTAPLKEAVSAVATFLLSGVGYPIGRTGVVITVGQYQLLVAEACAGLQSMFILEAMCLLYSHLVNHQSWWRNGLLALFAIPVSFLSNVVRVTILVMVTYHFGDAVGQGFIHNFAGLVLFAVALALIGGLDALLGLWLPDVPAAPAAQSVGAPPQPQPEKLVPASLRAVSWKAWGLALSLALTSVLSAALVPKLQPVAIERASVPLEQLFPAQFGPWRLDPAAAALIRPAFEQAKQLQTYDQVLERTYMDDAGRRVMLSVAYGRQQSVGLQMHRPEVCYKAGGFKVQGLTHGELALGGHELAVTRLMASMEGRAEPITYWRLLGDDVVADETHFRLKQLAMGAVGTIPDGMLVRVSTIDDDAPSAYKLQAAFVQAMARSLNEAQRKRVLGLH